MAKRFGGKYSPGDAPAQPGQAAPLRAQVDPVDGRANVMFAPAVVVVFTSLGGAAKLATGIGAAAVLLLGAWLLRDGLRAEAAYNARKVARRPALPRKALAAVLTGLGVAIAAFRNDQQVLASALFGIVAMVLHGVAFGLDPMKNKGTEGIDDFQQARVARAVDEAEAHLEAMSDAILRARDRKVEARVEQFQAVARDLFRTVEEDPRDLTGARKYLTVYLKGARDATVKFADIYARQADQKALADYTALLDDLEKNFAERTKKMLLDDHSDLTVEIDVLRDRLKREGVRPE